MSPLLKKVRLCACALLVCFSASVAIAEEPVADDQSQKGDRSEPALVIQYSSVFDDYIPFDEIPDIGWKEANDNVGQIGGWRAYAKLVQEEAKKKAELEAKENGDDQK